MLINEKELERYSRQIMIPGFGIEGQEKLKRAKVFIAGAGGLGCAVGFYLAAAGIGMLRIVDADVVDLSNLNRQILFGTADVGKVKAPAAASALTNLNPDIKVEGIKAFIDEGNVAGLVSGFDVIVDGMDNLITRQLLNAAAYRNRVPFVHGAVYGFEGRAMTVIPGETACLRCIYRTGIPPARCPALGATPALIGCIQATEVVKLITGVGDLLKDRLLVYDGLTMTFTSLRVKRDPQCPVCGDGGK